MNELLTNLSKVLPALFVLAAVFGFLGWSARGRGNQPAPTKSAKPANTGEKPQGQERAKNLEAALEKSKSAHKTLKAELDQLKSHSVAQAEFDKISADLEAARKAVESETRRVSALETELKKAQDAVKALNARTNEADKAQKDRSFALENELSKTREQLAILQNRPDESTDLLAEIERLRESVATTTRFSGELRKRETAAFEALEKAEAKIAAMIESGSTVPAPARKIGPVGDSNRIAAAKAEVLRLVEMNKQRTVESAAPEVAIAEAILEQPILEEVAAEEIAIIEPAVEKLVPMELALEAAETAASESSADEEQPVTA